ncbi:3-isopropylmalate dehydratase small subunit [Caballeronia sordidicola]|uniref:3-isopropylmalate dehydratase small subunit n=1 Tax=Caballeronia sordidicola TaxID=196367 RepID=A0A242N7L0_CABSO|nr:3-isopropylmalate dehydratase small subunit [Caballeronia sordidicola]OTP79631.1 3-isopropylmalate dehydratase small subunit [Caballeronia sordidicola]
MARAGMQHVRCGQW